MPPRFSLQPVLDYRHTRVEAFEVELSQLQSQREQALAFMENLRTQRRSLLDDLTAQQTGEIDLMMLNQVKGNLKATENRILKAQALLREIDRAVSKKRTELVSARQDEEALVVLKDKENERYQGELARRENRLQDDIYISQAFHHQHK